MNKIEETTFADMDLKAQLKAFQKMMKNALYFTLKALFIIRYLNFCLDFLVM